MKITSALGSRLSALGSRLSALGSRLSALGSRLSALGSRLSALGSRLSALGYLWEDLVSSRLSALGSRLSALGSRLSALGSRLSALGSRLSALSTALWEDPCPPAPAHASRAHASLRPHPTPCRTHAQPPSHRQRWSSLHSTAGRADVLLLSGRFSPSRTQPRPARLGAARDRNSFRALGGATTREPAERLRAIVPGLVKNSRWLFFRP